MAWILRATRMFVRLGKFKEVVWGLKFMMDCELKPNVSVRWYVLV